MKHTQLEITQMFGEDNYSSAKTWGSQEPPDLQGTEQKNIYIITHLGLQVLCKPKTKM